MEARAAFAWKRKPVRHGLLQKRTSPAASAGRGRSLASSTDRRNAPTITRSETGTFLIDREDFGEAQAAFAEGEKLLAFTRILHEIAMA